ncbi:MAG: YebC/PmpR family DNA-binding transcriptional regulator [Clostridiaceae bacterium]|jgi:YebC/PmpR family DNA-binding regulatory protein|nr:YebC/PmpR family DNA-binding transcriptional regulator [Clostridiaceae bacterium]
MSGHSKWSTIKRKKGEADAKRGKIFTKIGREIAVAVKEGGADPDTNTKLKDAIAKAKANNMPNDSITRSIKKAAGEGNTNNFEDIIYEGYGPNGVAVIVETLTDNRNRTAADMRHFFDKYGGNLGTSGCVMFMFEQKGVLIIENDGKTSEEKLIEDALIAGADDVEVHEEYFEVTTSPGEFSNATDVLEQAGYAFEHAQIQYVPQTQVKLTDENDLTQIVKLIDRLEDCDDVQAVWHNWEEEE